MILPSGVSLLDRIMAGGLHSGQFTHVYGAAASGKTTLGLQYMKTAQRLGYRTIYINSEAGSPIERLEQIAGERFTELQTKITMLIPHAFREQGALIDDLELYIHEDTKLVVVDTLTRLYRVGLDDKKTNYAAHRELNRQAGFLKGLARQRDIAVLVMNQVRGSFNTHDGFEPVAKNILDYWADYEIKIHLGRTTGERILEKRKPENGEEKQRLYLTMAGFAPEHDMKEKKK
jgi:RecA/RadA recombinase